MTEHVTSHNLKGSTRDRSDNTRPDVWVGTQARRPGLSLDQITVAAADIADSEGLAALSMRRLATRLGVGTMSLYYYVRNKDDVVALICDYAMSEAVVTDEELVLAWPEPMLAIAHRTLNMLQRHPWFPQIVNPLPGSNSIRHFDQTLQVVMRLDLPLIEQIALAATVDEYVYGFFSYDHPIRPDEVADAAGRMESLVATGHYPAFDSLRHDFGMSQTTAIISATRNDLSRFDRNLRHLLGQYHERQRSEPT